MDEKWIGRSELEEVRERNRSREREEERKTYRNSTTNDRLALSRQIQEERLQSTVESESKSIPIDNNGESSRLVAGSFELLGSDEGRTVDRRDLVEPTLDLKTSAFFGFSGEDEDIHIVGEEIAAEGCECKAKGKKNENQDETRREGEEGERRTDFDGGLNLVTCRVKVGDNKSALRSGEGRYGDKARRTSENLRKGGKTMSE